MPCFLTSAVARIERAAARPTVAQAGAWITRRAGIASAIASTPPCVARRYRTWWLAVLLGLAGAGQVVRAASDADELARFRLVAELAEAEGLTNARVLEAMRQTPRAAFVPAKGKPLAYFDMAVPIGHAQTATPPSVVAYMTERLDPQPQDRVLEIGTGCGYQAAVLSRLVSEVYTIEIIKPLGEQARATLRRLKYGNVQVRVGDGFKGWPEAAPFDRIMVTCSAAEVPSPLLAQLKEGGRLIMPLGEAYQQTLCQYTKINGVLRRERLLPTVFVPMTGEAQAARPSGAPAPPVHIVNGGFENVDPASGKLANWYHQRQLRLESAPGAPEGTRCVTFENATTGRQAHASQAFPIDGRETKSMSVSGMVRGSGIRPGDGKDQIAAVVITFYDDERNILRQEALGNWRGSFDWQPFNQTIAVPAAAREAIVHLGLLGATGTLSVDALVIGQRAPAGS